MSDALLRIPSPPDRIGEIADATQGLLAAFEPEALLSPVSEALADVADRADQLAQTDTEAIVTRLPAALEHLRGLLAPGTLEYVGSLPAAYSAVEATIRDHPLLGEILADQTVAEAGLSILEELVDDLHSRVATLVDQLLPTEFLQRLDTALTTLADFATEPPDEADLLTFLVDNLVGVGVDVLDAAAEEAVAAATAVAPVEAAADAASDLRGAQERLREGLESVVETIEALDPSAAEEYEQLQARIDQVEDRLQSVAAQLGAVYDDVVDVVDTQDAPALFADLTAALEAVPVERVLTVDDVVDAITALLDELGDHVDDLLRPDELRWRAELLSETIRAALAASPLAQVTEVLDSLAQGIRGIVRSVPVEEVQSTVVDLVDRAGAQLEALGLEDAEARLAEAFDALEEAASAGLDPGTLAESARDAVRGIASQLEALPIDQALAELQHAVEQAGEAVAGLGEAAGAELERLGDLLDELEPFDVSTASEAVIDEIDAVRERLDAMDPAALSDAERLAVAGALATLRALDLDATVLARLREELDEATRPVWDLLGEVATRLERFRDRLMALAPTEVLAPAAASLEQLATTVDTARARTWLAPASRRIEALEEQVGAADPARILAPLERPYADVNEALKRVDPEHWLRPASEAWSQVHAAVDRLDPGPLLEGLDARRREAFTDLRAAVLTAVENAEPPEPVAALLAELRPLIDQLTGALLDEPEQLRDLSEQAWTEIPFDGLFRPLDGLFERIVGVARSIPEDVLTGAAEEIRTRLSGQLDSTDPAQIMERLRSGSRRLDGLSPATVLGPMQALGGMSQRFAEATADAPDARQEDVAAVAARLEELSDRIDAHRPDSLRARLNEQHAATSVRLAAHVDAVDATAGATAHARVHGELRRLVPDFLRAPRPLTHAEVLDGLYGMRPSVSSRRILEAAERLVQQLTRLDVAVRPAMDELFDTVGEVLRLTSPAMLQGAVDQTYRAVRDTLAAWDPDDLTDHLHAELFEPLTATLAAADPAATRQRLEDSFEAARETLTSAADAMLDAVADAIDEELSELRGDTTRVLDELADGAALTDQSLQAVLEELDQLELAPLVERMEASVAAIHDDFDREFARVHRAFAQMLDAAPV